MKAFIINLKESVERRIKMENQLKKLKLKYELIDAVDGRKMSEQQKKSITQEVNYAFLPGEIGCALSHQKIYQRMLDESTDVALILEDDVILNADINEIIKKIPIKVDVPTVILLSRSNKYLKKPVHKLTDKYSLHKTHHATTTHSYILNKKAAQALLAGLYPVWMVADKWMLFEELSMVKVFSVVPHPVELSTEAGNSTINAQKGDLELNLHKKLIWNRLMAQRSVKAKLREKYRRAIVPIFNKVIDQGKG